MYLDNIWNGIEFMLKRQGHFGFLCVSSVAATRWCMNCTSTTSRSLLNFKIIGQGHRWFLCVFCVHDTVATHGQYLALSKAWRSSSKMLLQFMDDICDKWWYIVVVSYSWPASPVPNDPCPGNQRLHKCRLCRRSYYHSLTLPDFLIGCSFSG